MLQNSILVFQQILIMSIVMAFGYLLYKQKMVDNHVSKSLSKFVNTYVTPITIILSFNRPFEMELAQGLLWSFLLGMVLNIANIFLVAVVYPKHKPHAGNSRLCAMLSNNGFMAIPLVSAMFGAEGVALVSVNIVISAIFLWTYGVRTLSDTYRFTPKSLLTNPGIIAAVGGLLLFISPIKLPSIAFQGLNYIGSLNSPLGMMILGIYLAQLDLKSCFTVPDVWHTTAMRLVIMPLICVVAIFLLPMSEMAKYVLLIAFAAPSAITSAMFAQLYDTDYLFATRTVALTTILSLVTLPAMVGVLGIALHLVG